MGIEDIQRKIGDYLLHINKSFESVTDGMWIIHDELASIDNIVVTLEDPIVIFRVKLMNLPSSNREQFFEKLLQLNASSLVHGAYALENESVVIVDTLEAENLDLNEFQASIDAITMGITQDYKQLSEFLDQ